MKELFDKLSFRCSHRVTSMYSTSFSHAVKMLRPKIQNDIYAIYGFVRFADEIVDSFHGYDKKLLLDEFEVELNKALDRKISLNPILNAFQMVVHKYDIDYELIDHFMKSMRADLAKLEYNTLQEYEAYIYGSADVVGLMCLKVFVQGDHERYEELKFPAMKLGSAFQKVNFLRDIKDDYEILGRSYFPNLELGNLNKSSKEQIIQEIEEEFKIAYKGILKLPSECKLGVYLAYRYYLRLLKRLKNKPVQKILTERTRISNPVKISLLFTSALRYKLNLL